MRKSISSICSAAFIIGIAVPARGEPPVPLNNAADVAGLANHLDGQSPGLAAGGVDVPTLPYSTDQLGTITAYITALTGLQSAETASTTAKAAAATANLGPLANVQNSGDVTAPAGAGKVEGTLLAAGAVRGAAEALATRLCQSVEGDATAATCQPPIAPSKAGRSAATSFSAAPANGQKPASLAPAIRFPAQPELAGEDAICPLFSPFSDVYTRSDSPAIVIMANDQQTGFDSYDLMMMRLNAVGKQICAALKDAHNADAVKILTVAKPGAGGLNAGILPLMAVSAGLDLVAKLFRTEYTIGNIDITPDDQLLEKELVRAVEARLMGRPVYAPDLHSIVDLENNPVVAKIHRIDTLLPDVLEAARTQTLAATALTTAAAKPKLDPASVAAFNNAGALHSGASASLTAAAKAYTDLMTAATSGDLGKPNLLGLALKQAQVAVLLRSGGVAVVAKLDFIGASTYTKKNFWTAFGGMPFFASGGVLASFTVVDGKTAQILDAATVPIAGGYERVPDVHKKHRL